MRHSLQGRLSTLEQQRRAQEAEQQREREVSLRSLSDAELAELIHVCEHDIAAQMVSQPEWSGCTVAELARRLHADEPLVTQWIDTHEHLLGKEPAPPPCEVRAGSEEHPT